MQRLFVFALFFALIRCAKINEEVLNIEEANSIEEEEYWGGSGWLRRPMGPPCQKPPRCNFPPAYVPNRCLTSVIPGCDCPPGFALYIELTEPYNAYCQTLCLTQGIGGAVCNGLFVCDGTATPLPSCNIGTTLAPYVCRDIENDPCSNNTALVVANGEFYCFSNPVSTTATCPAGYSPECTTIQDTTCSPLSATSLQNLYQLHCKPTCPEPAPPCREF